MGSHVHNASGAVVANEVAETPDQSVHFEVGGHIALIPILLVRV